MRFTRTYPKLILISGELILLVVACASIGCAGPATPLGAPWATDSSQVRNGPLSFMTAIFNNSSNAEIHFTPERQVLHGRSPMGVRIKDPSGIKSNYKLVVRHNGLDVTQSFLRQAEISHTPTEIILKVDNVRLSPKADHLIEIIYGAGAGSDLTAYARYSPPICRAFDIRTVRSTATFSPGATLLNLIENVSKQNGFSPAFTTALIAQESAFNSRTVSWARAIGLTQVTPVAEDEVTEMYSAWPRYPGLNELPAPIVKMLILSGSVNENNEWRLDPARSIQGGLAYMQMLAERWSSPENLAKIKLQFDDPDTGLTRLILASYNSGFARVYTAFSRHGAAFLQAPELREARKYVNRISSYCDHFTTSPIFQGGTSNENET